MRRFLFSFAFVVGCSGGSFELSPAADDADVDSSASDSASDATVDSTVEETAADTATTDTATTDTATTDTATTDTATTDTGTADTATSDTATSDTGSDSGSTDSDSGAADSGGPTDSGTDSGTPDVFSGCPSPPSTEPPKDVSSMTCDELRVAYPAAVNSAKACGCEADCSQEVPKDFCNCPTIVSPSAPGYTTLEPMRQRWKDLHCSIICPLIACKTPVLAGCFPGSGTSGPTVCTLK